jgi:hypothetical protein
MTASIKILPQDKFKNGILAKINKYIKIVPVLINSLVLAAMMTSILFIIENRSTGTENKKNDAVMRELNEISAEVHTVSMNPNIKEQNKEFDLIEKNIAAVQQTIADVAKSSDVQKVSNQITSVKDDVDFQMNDIKKAVSEGMGNKQYLDESSLPFSIISVDVVSSEPYVSVNYADHITPLGISDTLANWRLVSADFDGRSAEFVNEKNQYVKISLKG